MQARTVTDISLVFATGGAIPTLGPVPGPLLERGRRTRTRASWMVSWGRTLPLLLGLAVLAGPAPAVTIDWVTAGDPGNAADTATNCYAANCGSVADSYLISKYEVTNAQYAEFLNAKGAADPLGLYNIGMAGYGIARSGSPGSYTYTVNTSFANKPVTCVSFYDSLRFANWLNNGQGSAEDRTAKGQRSEARRGHRPAADARACVDRESVGRAAGRDGSRGQSS